MLQPQLNSLYQAAWTRFNAALPKDRGISNPLLINVPSGYEIAQLKLIIIGKETHSWVGKFGNQIDSTAVECLVEHYSKFNFGKEYVKSPFWQAAHALQRKLAPKVPENGFIWTNLFICDQNQNTPENDIADKLRDISILNDELRILNPDALVFFTGSLYDYTIMQLFPNAEILPLDGGNGKLLSQVTHPHLPIKSYRTYHPKFLRLRKKMSILDDIAEKINS